MAWNFVISVALLAVLPLCLCQSLQKEWTYKEYPNPLEDSEACGREDRDDGKKAYLCDPNNILKENEAAQIDVMIDLVRNETECPCSRNVCEGSSSPGYRIMVALVNKIRPDDSAGSSNLNMKDKLHHASVFARNIMSRWKYGRCDEQVIILFSLEDNVLYTMAGDEAMQKLDTMLIGEIAMKHRVHFGSGRPIFTGLQRVITDYKAVFRGEYEAMEYKTQKPQYQPVLGAASQPQALAIFTTILTILIALML